MGYLPICVVEVATKQDLKHVIPNASHGQLARAVGPPVSDPFIFCVISKIDGAITSFKTLGSLGSKDLT